MTTYTPYSHVSSNFWETHLKGRPQVPQSLFTRLFSYHTSHGGQFSVANDVGAGFGHFSARLGAAFKKVIVTEASEGSLDLARSQLVNGTSYDESKYRFICAKFEDDEQNGDGEWKAGIESTFVKPASVDLVFAANVMHSVSPLDRGIDAISRQLKPGGTFFAGLWGMSILENKELDAIWRRIFDPIYEKAEDVIGNERLRQILDIQDSGYDAIYLPEDVWTNVRRVKINTRDKGDGDGADVLKVFRNARRDASVPGRIEIGDHETVVKEEDDAREWWFEVGLDGLKAMVGSFPVEPDKKKVMNKLWDEMEVALDGGRATGYFPASFIMATKI